VRLNASWPRTYRLRREILEIERPFHPVGQPNAAYETDGNDMPVFMTDTPSYAEVLEVRAGRVATVRESLAGVTPDELAATRKNPRAPSTRRPRLSCLHVILEERSGSTTATPYAIWTRSRSHTHDPVLGLANPQRWTSWSSAWSTACAGVPRKGAP
jgi:hypothetical protein